MCGVRMNDGSMPPALAVAGGHIRRIVIAQSRRAHVGHIGSCLSVADMLAVVYGDLLRAQGPDDPDRDRFVLSKGHAALALYAALRLRGWLTDADLDTFCADGTLLGVHPDHRLTGVDFATGSLGMGLSFVAGAALAARLQGSQRRCYALLSDAECNAGSLWETVMFAAHHRLDNLTALIDVNGQQALGYTADVLSTAPLLDRFASFDWDAVEVDGHDRAAMHAAACAPRDGRPRVLLCATVFGKGVSFMERKIEWHYLPMSAEQYRVAFAELEAAGCA
jgi:transketolase